MGILTPLVKAGLQATVADDGTLKIYGDTKAMRKDQAKTLYAYIKQNKPAIMDALQQTGEPGQCESCEAAGYWDYSQYADQGLLCFHYAYFLGKPGKPKPCEQARALCPLENLPTAGRPRCEAIAPGRSRPSGWGPPLKKVK